METLDLGWVGLTLAVVVMLLYGTGQSALRAELPSDLAVRLVLLVAGVVGVWLMFASMLAQSGALAQWDALPPRPMLLPLTALVGIAIVARTTPFARLAIALPLSWPIAAQTFRLFVELLLHAVYAAGDLPVQMTWEGRNLDVITGVTAPLVALAATYGAPRWALVAWNVVGLALLVNVVGTAVTSVPGPLHLDWPGAPLTIVATWPFVWLPAFLVPFALFAHVVSLRQLFAPAAARD